LITDYGYRIHFLTVYVGGRDDGRSHYHIRKYLVADGCMIGIHGVVDGYSTLISFLLFLALQDYYIGIDIEINK
jgi:hypothetical protein